MIKSTLFLIEFDNKTIPFDPEIERIVLGSMLVDSSVIDETLSKVKDQTVFYEKRHQIIFRYST